MRIEKLELLAFGPFRGLELELGAPGLHVVFGRNEAGKSTTLRAIAGLLYGIPHRTPDAHTHKDLRIGGTLVGDDGERVRVIRRKGVANTLLDESGKAIDEAIVLRLLRGVTEETFKSAFALDHVTLRSGAQALLDGKGDLGESLFDASVGGGGEVQQLLRQLGEEAESLYKPRGRSDPLNEALHAFADAKKAVKNTERLPESYVTQERGLVEAREQHALGAKRRVELERRKRAIERASKRVPLEKKRARAAEERASLGAIASHAARVRSIESRLAGYERDRNDRSERAAEADRLRDRVADAARRAGVDPARAADPTLRLDAGAERRIQRLVTEGSSLAVRLDAARVEIARSERELARLRAAVPASSPADAAELVGATARARALGATETRHASEAARVAKRRRDLDARVASLGLFEGTPEALAVLRVPAAASVAELAARAALADRAVASASDRVAEIDAQAASAERQLAEHTGDFAPPDAAALRDARGAREAAWDALRAADAKSRAACETAFERAVARADQIADRLIHEADRVTTIARLRELARAHEKHRDESRAHLARAEKARAALDDEHRALFAPAAIEPLGFAEMRAWLDRRAQIVERLEELRVAEDDVEEEGRAIAAAKAELAAALGAFAPSPPGRALGSALGNATSDTERLGDLVALASRRIEEADAARREAAGAVTASAKLEAQLAERRASAEQDDAAFAELRTRLSTVIAPLGLGGVVHFEPASPCASAREWEDAIDEIARATETLRELFGLVDRRAEAEARAALAEREARSFEEEVARAASELAADLGGVPPIDAANALAQRSRRADALAQELDAIDARLAELGDEPVAGDIAALAEDSEATARAIEEIDIELDQLVRELSRHDQQIGALTSGLEQMKADSGAAEASTRAQEALARVRSNVERYARAKLAFVLLQREIERYREQNQGPLLGRASQLFAQLTEGAFTGVRAGFDDHDRAALACVRAGGVEVGVAGLSEGTRDQLYLSLRLASLLRHAEITGPMPLVLDDVLIHFDDERSRATLAALGEVASHMQILFFTHHARLLELAREALGSSLTVHELAPAPPPIEDQRQWM